MGLHIDVYRRAGAEPCGGVSDTANRLTVMNVAGPDTPSADAPAFVLEAHSQYRDSPLLRPVDVEAFKGQRGPMFGGNYAGVWDRRWLAAVHAITGNRSFDLVKVHDRFEVGE